MGSTLQLLRVIQLDLRMAIPVSFTGKKQIIPISVHQIGARRLLMTIRVAGEGSGSAEQGFNDI